ncbi:MAG: serine/threonine protein kinase, partial [Polyangiaceae bacterium]|nr:serine/threonine protein kinase [Polyangiaceae bacterium]
YKVEHVRIGKLLAMKLLAGELSRNQEVVRRFKTEALTASKLSSPNTVQVFDFGVSEHQGLTYLVMELVTGDDLGRVLKLENALPATRVGRIVVQVANSLAEAHQHGIVHRDVKPENVMILPARDGTDLAKVLDFGLAKLREGSELSELTSQGAIVGTPYFMSPEQVRGEAVDPRSDIYSLGALMYRALTGLHPFSGPSPMSVFAKHLTEQAVPPHQINPAVPLGMSEIVMRALRKDPAERFQRVEDLQAAIISELSELGTSGVEALLDSGAIRRLERQPQAAQATDAPAIATRDEVESYERKLRRTRVGLTAFLSLLPFAAAGAGAHYLLKERPLKFGGVEQEPNNSASEANAVPFGEAVSAMLGKRITSTQSDVDFFSIEVPSGDAPVALNVGALPNLASCVQIFRKGMVAPTAQYCPGLPSLDLQIPALRLEPGAYYVAVMQDLDARGKTAPFVHENVSDEYTVTLGPSSGEASFEIEPNDAPASAHPIGADQTVSGMLGWVGDVDTFCPKLDSTALYRFRIDDDPREGGAVLSVALSQNGAEGHAVRVHTRRGKPATENDAAAPYTGFTFRGTSPPCLVVRLALDPGAASPVEVVPRGSHAKYRVGLEVVP